MDNPNHTIRAGGRDWTPAEAHKMRAMLADPVVLTKDIALVFGVDARMLQRPAFKKKMGIAEIDRPRHGGRNNIGRLGIPTNCHPLVKRLYQLINRERITGKEVSLRAGLCNRAVYLWRKQMPRVDTFDAALNVLGFRLAIIPLDARQAAKDEAEDG